jgi:hypothetical protein
VVTAITYGLPLEASVGQAYAAMDRPQLSTMLCGTEKQKAHTLENVILNLPKDGQYGGQKMWDTLKDNPGLTTHNVNHGGTMENMMIDFFLLHEEEPKEGEYEYEAGDEAGDAGERELRGLEQELQRSFGKSLDIETAGIASLNERHAIFGTPIKTVSRYNEEEIPGFNLTYSTLFRDLCNLRNIDLGSEYLVNVVFERIIQRFILPPTTQYNVDLLAYFQQRAVDTVNTDGQVYGRNLLKIPLSELLPMLSRNNPNIVLYILACRSDEVDTNPKISADHAIEVEHLRERTQEFERGVNTPGLKLERPLDEQCKQTYCAGMTRNMPGPGASIEYCRQSGCLDCAPDPEMPGNPMRPDEVAMVCRSCSAIPTVLVRCSNDQYADIVCFTIAEANTVYQGYIDANNHGNHTISAIPFAFSEGVTCTFDEMTIAALLCMYGPDAYAKGQGCAHIRTPLHESLESGDHSRMRAAYQRFLDHVISPFVYAERSAMKDLYANTVSVVMNEYINKTMERAGVPSHAVWQEGFFEVICGRTDVNLQNFKNCEEPLPAYMALTLDYLWRLLSRHDLTDDQYRAEIIPWVEGVLTHLPDEEPLKSFRNTREKQHSHMIAGNPQGPEGPEAYGSPPGWDPPRDGGSVSDDEELDLRDEDLPEWDPDETSNHWG